MITGDIAAALGTGASGTWRPPPGGAPGTYATSLPFRLACEAGREPGEVAAGLAAALRGVAWISGASVTGRGYLTVTVTPAALASLAVRVARAGRACAASDALRGISLTAPASDDPADAACWDEAGRRVRAAVTGRLAAAAGATVKTYSERPPRPGPSAPAAAVAFAGGEAIRYALASLPPARPALIEPATCVRNDLDCPFFAVRYARASAASVLRWAGDLGLDAGPPEAFRPDLLDQRAERDLLGAISWLPERVAAAARRRRPDAFTRYLEALAGAWLGCREACPALPFGGRAAPRDEPGTAARLWLAAAARTALGTGLRLCGVAPPERL